MKFEDELREPDNDEESEEVGTLRVVPDSESPGTALVPVEENSRAKALVAYQRKRIGDLLLSEGKISESGIARILRAQEAKSSQKFGELAVRLKLVSERDVQIALCHQFGYPSVETLEDRVSTELFMALAPFSKPADSLNKILGRLLLTKRSEGFVVAIVSPDSADGRSRFAANLALAYAQSGKKTLLIDADLRNPRQHRLFGLRDSLFGLTSILVESHRVGAYKEELEIAASTSLYGLSVVQSGVAYVNPIEILTSNRFARLVEDAREAFDAVIIDTPPAQAYPDAEAIAAVARNILLIARENHSHLAGVQSLVESAKQRGVEILGTVLCGA